MTESIRGEDQRIENLPEWETLQTVRRLRTSLYVFEVNHKELAEALKLYCNLPAGVQLMNVNRRHRLNDYFDEVLRRNHNFVAAAQSLVDHSRNLYRELYEPNNRFPDYVPEIEARFTVHPLTQFVIRFRQFCQHYRSPNISAQMKFTQEEGLSRTITLSTEDLNDFSGWNTASRQYINEHGPQICLQTVVDDYYAHIMSFYRWFYERIERICEISSDRSHPISLMGAT